MRIGIVGYGNIGQALHQKYLVPYEKQFDWVNSEKYDVTVFDVDPMKNCRSIDDPKLNEMELIVCAAPASQTKYWVDYAVKNRKHYIGFTEDVSITKYAESVALPDRVMIPQCGIAPGIVNIIADSYARAYSNISEIEIRVGALPRSTLNELRYSFTWSPEGVLNEYQKDCEIITERTRKIVPGMSGYETLIIDGAEYEAFHTSGGIGSLCETYENKANRVNYKTVRYVGHHAIAANIHKLDKTFQHCPVMVTTDDMVIFHISVVGHHGDGKLRQLSYTKKVFGDGVFSAIQHTTAMGAYVWINALLKNPSLGGYIRQEQYNDYGVERADMLFD